MPFKPNIELIELRLPTQDIRDKNVEEDKFETLNDHGWLYAISECWAGRAYDSQSAKRLTKTNNYITHTKQTQQCHWTRE